MPRPFGSKNRREMHQTVQKNFKIPIKNAATLTICAKLLQDEPNRSKSSKTAANEIASYTTAAQSRKEKKEARKHPNKSKHCPENSTKTSNQNEFISHVLTATKSKDFHPNQSKDTRSEAMPPRASNGKSNSPKTSNKNQQNVMQSTDARCHKNCLPIITKRSDSHSF